MCDTREMGMLGQKRQTWSVTFCELTSRLWRCTKWIVPTFRIALVEQIDQRGFSFMILLGVSSEGDG
jgi:hypothetical protein